MVVTLRQVIPSLNKEIAIITCHYTASPTAVSSANTPDASYTYVNLLFETGRPSPSYANIAARAVVLVHVLACAQNAMLQLSTKLLRFIRIQDRPGSVFIGVRFNRFTPSYWKYW